MMKSLFSWGVIAMLVGGVLVAPTDMFAAGRGFAGPQGNANMTCNSGRAPLKVMVEVESFVYQDDADADRDAEQWVLWAANEDAWIWGAWGSMTKYLDKTFSANTIGYICGKKGDAIRINGMFDNATKHLVYRTRTANAADQIRTISIEGRPYSIGSGKPCVWESNGLGGYDVVCEVR